MKPDYKELDQTKTYLITGAAGFIGFFLAKRLLEQGCRVIGIDNLNDYYDVKLKYARLEQLKTFDKFAFSKVDIADKFGVTKTFAEYQPDITGFHPRKARGKDWGSVPIRGQTPNLSPSFAEEEALRSLLLRLLTGDTYLFVEAKFL